jgi:hypothetical protein
MTVTVDRSKTKTVGISRKKPLFEKSGAKTFFFNLGQGR